MSSNIDKLKQAKELLKLVGNNGKDLLIEDFTNDPGDLHDRIFLAIKHIDATIELFLNEPEYGGTGN